MSLHACLWWTCGKMVQQFCFEQKIFVV